MTIDIKDIEELQKHFVAPLVDALRAEIKPAIEKVQAIDAKVDAMASRVGALEKDQKKALVGYGVFSTALAGVLSIAWVKIKSYVHFGG